VWGRLTCVLSAAYVYFDWWRCDVALAVVAGGCFGFCSADGGALRVVVAAVGFLAIHGACPYRLRTGPLSNRCSAPTPPPAPYDLPTSAGTAFAEGNVIRVTRRGRGVAKTVTGGHFVTAVFPLATAWPSWLGPQSE